MKTTEFIGKRSKKLDLSWYKQDSGHRVFK